MTSILLVDDSETETQIISKWLKELGHLTYVANNANEGISLAKEKHPQIILMDIVMPDKSGYEAIRELRRDEKTKMIPIIIISTRTTETDIIWGLRQGAKLYLGKPFHKNELEAAINKILL